MKSLRTRISFSLMANTWICHPTSLYLGHFNALLCRETLGWTFCRLLSPNPLLQGFWLSLTDPGSLQLSNSVGPFLSLGSMENIYQKVARNQSHPIDHVKVGLPHCLRMEPLPSIINCPLHCPVSISRSICLQSLRDDVPLM